MNIVAVPGKNQLFVTHSTRRFPNAPPTPAPFTPAPVRDEEAEAVKAVPPTPDEAPHEPRVLPAPISSAPALEGDALDDIIGQAAEAGSLPSAVGLQVPSTPIGGPLEFAGGALEAPIRGTSTSSGAVHSRESASKESERLPKHARICSLRT